MCQLEDGCNFVKFEECQDKKTSIKILRQSHAVPLQEVCMALLAKQWLPRESNFWTNVECCLSSQMWENSLSAYICCWHVSLCGQMGELVLPYSQAIGNGRVQNWTLFMEQDK